MLRSSLAVASGQLRCAAVCHEHFEAPERILSGISVCQSTFDHRLSLSEECRENRGLIQLTASRSPLTVKIDLK